MYASGPAKSQVLTYDNGHRLINDEIYGYVYEHLGCACSTRISQVTGPNGTRGFVYDFKNRITSDTTTDGAFGVTVSRVYNDAAHEKTVKLGDTELFTIKTDAAGRALEIREKLGGADNVYVISYENSGRVWQRVYPNKNKSVTEYDNEGRIKKHVNYLENRVISRYEHELDAEGNKKNEKNMVGTRQYTYDNTYQLTAAQYERGQAFTWDYDAAGNREYSNEQLTMNSEKVKNYSKNSLNQYTAVNSRSYTYDADGNLKSDGTRTFTWDKKNRLTGVVMGTTIVSYVYDHNDLRVKKTVTKSGVSKVTRYIYDGSLLLAEYEDDVLVKVYINDGEGVVGMVRYLYNEGSFSHYQRLYYLYDTLGSVAQVTAENGLVLQEYLYTPYGEAYNTAADSVNGLRFVGRYGGYTDDDVKLTYFWHRWYDSADGRWVSRDPIGVAGGVNLYGYVGNRAGNRTDRFGLEEDSENEIPIITIINYFFKPICTPTPEPPVHPKPVKLQNCENNNNFDKKCYDDCVEKDSVHCDGISAGDGREKISVGKTTGRANIKVGNIASAIAQMACYMRVQMTCEWKCTKKPWQ